MVAETGLDAVVGQIERDTRDPFGHWQGGKTLIDSEILERFADPDEMRYAEQSSRTFLGRFRKAYPGEVTEGEAEEIFDGGQQTDFRDSLDDCECDHLAGRVCIKCCTSRDLMAIPDLTVYERVNLRLKAVGSNMEVVFDLVFKPSEARRIGLAAEHDVWWW